jgi:hypothetical protein
VLYSDKAFVKVYCNGNCHRYSSYYEETELLKLATFAHTVLKC